MKEYERIFEYWGELETNDEIAQRAREAIGYLDCCFDMILIENASFRHDLEAMKVMVYDLLQLSHLMKHKPTVEYWAELEEILRSHCHSRFRMTPEQFALVPF